MPVYIVGSRKGDISSKPVLGVHMGKFALENALDHFSLLVADRKRRHPVVQSQVEPDAPGVSGPELMKDTRQAFCCNKDGALEEVLFVVRCYTRKEHSVKMRAWERLKKRRN